MLLPNYHSQIATILANLFDDTSSDSILLINSEGVLCGAEGNYASNEAQSLQATMRGDIFALLAKHSGDSIKRPGMTFHQEASHGVLIAEVSQNHVLALVLHKGVHIGLVKKCTRKATEELNQILEAA